MFENVSEVVWTHILAYAWKCWKTFLWTPSGPTLWPGLRQRSDTTPTVVRNNCAWKRLKMYLWKLSGPTFWPAPGSAWKCNSGTFLSLQSGMRLEMLENESLEVFCPHPGQRLEMLTNVSASPLGQHCGLRL